MMPQKCACNKHTCVCVSANKVYACVPQYTTVQTYLKMTQRTNVPCPGKHKMYDDVDVDVNTARRQSLYAPCRRAARGRWRTSGWPPVPYGRHKQTNVPFATTRKQEHARTARDVCDSLSKVQVLARKRAKSEIREGGTHGMPEVEKSYILPVRGNHTQAGQRERRDRDSTLLAVSARRAIFSR